MFRYLRTYCKLYAQILWNYDMTIFAAGFAAHAATKHKLR